MLRVKPGASYLDIQRHVRDFQRFYLSGSFDFDALVDDLVLMIEHMVTSGAVNENALRILSFADTLDNDEKPLLLQKIVEKLGGVVSDDAAIATRPHVHLISGCYMRPKSETTYSCKNCVVRHEITPIDHNNPTTWNEVSNYPAQQAHVIIMLRVLCQCYAGLGQPGIEKTCGGVLVDDMETFLLNVKRHFVMEETRLFISSIIRIFENSAARDLWLSNFGRFFEQEFGIDEGDLLQRDAAGWNGYDHVGTIDVFFRPVKNVSIPS